MKNREKHKKIKKGRAYMNTFKNPILAGFYPDPSICRVLDDYYLVTSTFSYFPGVPIFHSKDLVNWKQIGNILDRNDQVDFKNGEVSQGIFAPTIRYHKGMFYMITTNVTHGGNFIVTSENPEGPWSNPYYLEGADGIDPSLFFDDDDRVYYTGTNPRREGASYYGDNEIWLQEVDLKNMKLIGESYPIWHGALKNTVWPEGPHIYKKDDYYYLLISEGGTAFEHAITIARSKTLKSEFVGNKCNPILTHRHFGKSYPITNVGHGDLVETQNGEWWMVLLASRPYGGYYRNLGRETFLTPVKWEDGWPVINYGVGFLEEIVKCPDLPHYYVEENNHYDFNENKLNCKWMFLRNPVEENFSLTDRKGYLRIKLSPNKITELSRISYVCLRQQDKNFEIETVMEFNPKSETECAGLIVFQNHKYHYRLLLIIEDNIQYICLIKCENAIDTCLAKEKIDGCRLYLKLIAMEQNLSFYFASDDYIYNLLFQNADGRILSTDVAGGFVGTTLGLYCSSNGVASDNYADFNWFKYNNVT
jgi:xylan 1,4-beta-xylosidase